MTGAAVFICIFLLIVFTLTRKVYVKIKKEDVWRVELHFTLSAIHFKKTVAGDKPKEKKKKQKKKKHTLHYYREIADRISDILPYSEVRVKKLHIPSTEHSEQAQKSFTRPYGYHSVISAFLALISSYCSKLEIDDNAIILIPDGKELSLDITVTVRLFRIIPALLTFMYTERIMKGKKSYVGK